MPEFVAWMNANTWVFPIIFVWDVSWRLLALWYSARQNQKIWFVSLMLINSVGLLPLAYLVFFSQDKFWKNLNWNKNKTDKVEEAVVVKKISPRPSRSSGHPS